MKKILFLLFISVNSVLCAQSVNKLIKEENVTRIIKTLASDDMMGRSATRPEHIERAADFLEKEFSVIKLNKFTGLATYRQEFKKDMIIPGPVRVTINGTNIPAEQIVVSSENTRIHYSNNLTIKTIEYDSTVKNKRQYILSKAFNLVRGDTSSNLVLVDPNLEKEFNDLKSYFGKRLVANRKGTKIFVVGKFEVQSYSITGEQQWQPITMANIIGVIPGKSKPDEFVVFSGHYDHIGIRPPISGDSIANGADDDASGTTAVVELARYFKKARNNQRTLIFVAFTAEEIGGFGSRYFSEQLNPDKVVAMFNIEMIGKPSKWGPNFAFITGYERSDFGEILQKNLTGTPFEFKPDPYPQQNLFYRSDNATLARLGVPAHTISTDEIDIDKYYHTVNDEVETLDLKNLTATIRAIALSAQSIVSGKDTPKRIDKSTVR